MKFSNIVLFLIVLLTGFNAGIGFGNAAGYMLGFEDTPATHALSYWQNADHYFRARMPFVGNAMLLSIAVALVWFRGSWKKIGFWLMACALLLSVGDLVVILTLNLPLNEAMQQMRSENLDANYFETLRQDALTAYYIRSVLTIGAFVLAIVAAHFLSKDHVPRTKEAI